MRESTKVKRRINLQICVISLISVFLLYFCVTLLISSITKDPPKLTTQLMMFFRKKVFIFNMNWFCGLPFLTDWFDEQNVVFGI